MLRKLMLIAAALLALTLAHSYSPPSEAVPLYLDAAANRTDAGAIFVRRHYWSWRYQQRQTGVAVFIVPGLFWGPAWWDPTYSQLCWKKARPCRGCAENWIFVC